MTQGVDLSHYNGPVNWSALKADGVPFCLHKCTEGDDPALVDARYTTNRASALAEGIPFGPYHWFHSTANQLAAAALFTQHANWVPGMICAFLDVEVADGNTPATITTQIHNFATAWARPLGMYTYEEFWTNAVAPVAGNDLDLAARPLWLARYNTIIGAIPAPWTSVAIWQDTDHNSLPGIDGPVDGDVLISQTLAQLIAYGAGQPYPPPPEEDPLMTTPLIEFARLPTGQIIRADLLAGTWQNVPNPTAYTAQRALLDARGIRYRYVEAADTSAYGTQTT